MRSARASPSKGICTKKGRWEATFVGFCIEFSLDYLGRGFSRFVSVVSVVVLVSLLGVVSTFLSMLVVVDPSRVVVVVSVFCSVVAVFWQPITLTPTIKATAGVMMDFMRASP
jgi:hypothetical protein